MFRVPRIKRPYGTNVFRFPGGDGTEGERRAGHGLGTVARRFAHSFAVPLISCAPCKDGASLSRNSPKAAIPIHRWIMGGIATIEQDASFTWHLPKEGKATSCCLVTWSDTVYAYGRSAQEYKAHTHGVLKYTDIGTCSRCLVARVCPRCRLKQLFVSKGRNEEEEIRQ